MPIGLTVPEPWSRDIGGCSRKSGLGGFGSPILNPIGLEHPRKHLFVP